jgi:hypothetical protein
MKATNIERVIAFMAFICAAMFVVMGPKPADVSRSQDNTAVPSPEISAALIMRADEYEVYKQAAQECTEPGIESVAPSDWYGVAYDALPDRLKGLYIPTVNEVLITAQMTYGEARGILSITEQAGVIWIAINRVSAEGYGMGRSLEHVITFPGQFHGYNLNNSIIDDYGRDFEALVIDVVTRWINEQLGIDDAGRVLPDDFLWFEGDGEHNYFRNAYRGEDAEVWDWTMESPYEN